jgi:hypothetical protein
MFHNSKRCDCEPNKLHKIICLQRIYPGSHDGEITVIYTTKTSIIIDPPRITFNIQLMLTYLTLHAKSTQQTKNIREKQKDFGSGDWT